MNNLKNYILKGKGIGALILLGLSLILSLYYTYATVTVSNLTIPYVQDVIYKVAPIKVVDGQVVVPENTVRQVQLLDGLDYYLTIDTTTDDLNISGLKQGLYLTRSKFYGISPQKVEVKQLAGSFELERDDYTEVMHSFVKWIGVFVFGFSLVCLFAGYLLINMFFTLVTKISELINKTQLSFDVKMRMNAVLFSAVVLALFVLKFAGLYLGVWSYILIMVLLQIIFIPKLTK